MQDEIIEEKLSKKEDISSNETDKEEPKAPPQEEKKEDSVQENNIDYKDKYLRMLADAENTRKRLQKEKYETLRFSIENTILDFLPILDNFENALKFSQNASEDVKNWAMGFQMILSQFRDLLHNNGIVAFHSEGNLFDPHFHEAMEIVETEEHPDGTILEEYAKGYKSEQRTIRPARVKVAKKPSQEETISALEDSLENEIKEDLNTKQQEG